MATRNFTKLFFPKYRQHTIKVVSLKTRKQNEWKWEEEARSGECNQDQGGVGQGWDLPVIFCIETGDTVIRCMKKMDKFLFIAFSWKERLI